MLSLRPQTPQDEAFLTGLFESVKAAEFAMLPVLLRAGLIRMQYNAMTVAYRSGFPKAGFDIVLLDDRPVGRLIHDWSPDRLHIVLIAFRPEWRRRGLGSALMHAMLDEARRLGLRCEATVAADNLPSLRLWARLGFTKEPADAVNVAVTWQPDERQPPGS